MGRDQADELIGVAWLAMAAFDMPYDHGTMIYIVLSALALLRALRFRLGRTPGKEADHDH